MTHVDRKNRKGNNYQTGSIHEYGLNDLLNYARYQELTSKVKASQKEVDALSKSVNKKWWAKNRKRIMS